MNAAPQVLPIKDLNANQLEHLLNWRPGQKGRGFDVLPLLRAAALARFPTGTVPAQMVPQ